MPEFVANENRDAWNVIRGYVYQVDLSIARWLDLPPGTVLELERGEDIDLVPQVLDGEAADQDRVLEQIKHLEGSSLTLRSARAVEAIANAIEHYQTNPELDLLFRFSTNAHIGIEQLSPFRPRSGVEVWESIRRGELAEDALLNALTGVRQILDAAPRPQGMSDETWDRFTAFFREQHDEPLYELIRRFEWSSSQPNATRMSERIVDTLIRTGRTNDRRAGQEMYERLFLYVFKLLTQQCIKRLTPEELDRQVELPTLSEHDHALLGRLQAWFHQIEARLTSVELFASNLHVQLTTIAAQVGIVTRLTSGPSPPMLDPPALVEQMSPRETNVGSFRALLGSNAWLALHGAALSGKTQLGVLIVRALAGEVTWLRCRGAESALVCRGLDEALATKSGIAPTAQRAAWFDRACRALGRNPILVLDDLPKLSAGDELCERLALLARSCEGSQVRLLTLSAHPLPESLRLLGEGLLVEREVPRFSGDETRELLAARGAPQAFLQPGWPEMITALGHSHPGVIATIISYLEEGGWAATSVQIEALFQHDYASELNGETLDRLTASVQEDETRELLYRLSLVGNTFTLGDAQALAGVEPPLNRPRERLRALSGLWVHGERERMEVSPLIRTLGADDVAPVTRKACFRVLAERIAQQESINQYQALQALVYFRRADEYQRAAIVHALLLSNHLANEEQHGVRSLLEVLSDRPLETEIDLGVRIYIRSMQIALFERHGRGVRFLVDDLDALLQQADRTHSAAILAAAVLAAPAIIETRAASAFAYLRRALDTPVELPPGEEFSLPEGYTAEAGLVWMVLSSAQTPAPLRAWLDFYAGLSPELQERIRIGQWAETGAMAFSGRLLLVEEAAPEEDRDWPALFTTLGGLAVRARQFGFGLLCGTLRRSQLIVLAEYQNNLDGAVDLARASLTEAADDPTVSFLLTEYIGERFCEKRDMAEAARWLDQAFAYPSDAYPDLRSRGLLYTARTYAGMDVQKSVVHARAAVEEARRAEDLPPTELVRAQAELGIALWAAGESRATVFGAWDRAAETLMSAREQTPEWKSLFALFGHVNGFFAALALNGRPPESVAGGGAYQPPEQGIFLKHVPGREALYSRTKELAVVSQLSMFARAVGSYDRARDWLRRGLDDDRGRPESLASAQLGRDNIPLLIADNQFADALDSGLRYAVIATATPLLAEPETDVMAEAVDFGAVLGARGSENWARAEGLAFHIAIWPVAIRLVTIALADRAEARRQANDLARLCRSQASNSAVPALWEESAALLEAGFDGATQANVLITKGGNWARSGETKLAMLAYLFASAMPGCSLVDACQLHQSITPLVEQFMAVAANNAGNGIAEFLLGFWRHRFENARFGFRKPGNVENLLARVPAQPPLEQSKFLLRAIADGLGCNPPSGGNA